MEGFGSAPPSPEQMDRALMREDSEYFGQFDPEERLEAIKQVLGNKDNQPIPVIGSMENFGTLARVKEDLARQERGEEPLKREPVKPKGPNLLDEVKTVLEARRRVAEV